MTIVKKQYCSASMLVKQTITHFIRYIYSIVEIDKSFQLAAAKLFFSWSYSTPVLEEAVKAIQWNTMFCSLVFSHNTSMQQEDFSLYLPLNYVSYPISLNIIHSCSWWIFMVYDSSVFFILLYICNIVHYHDNSCKHMNPHFL